MANVRTNGKADAQDITAQIDTIKGDIATLTSMMSEMAQSKTEDAKAQAAGKAAAFKASAVQKADDAQALAVNAGERMLTDAEAAYLRAEETVRQQPAMAVGIAAGLGFLVGMMATRRS